MIRALLGTRIQMNSRTIVKFKTVLKTAAFAVALIAANNVSADAVTDWNEITVKSVAAARLGPLGSLDTALVHLAIHDTIQAYEHRFEPFQVGHVMGQGNKVAAVASAAHALLVSMYPAQE